MGADYHAKGLARDKCYHAGYFALINFRIKLAKIFNKEAGDLLEYFWIQKRGCDKEISKKLDTMFTDEQKLVLFVNDSDDKWTPQQSKLAYLAIKDIQLDYMHSNYGSNERYNMLELFKGMYYHSWKHRVNLYVS